MAPAVLFAHETDAIYAIRPEAWSAEIVQVARGIAFHNPIYVTMDEALRYVGATRTLRLESVQLDPPGRMVLATFRGQADAGTHFWLCTETPEGIQVRLVDVPAFADEATVGVGFDPGTMMDGKCIRIRPEAVGAIPSKVCQSPGEPWPRSASTSPASCSS